MDVRSPRTASPCQLLRTGHTHAKQSRLLVPQQSQDHTVGHTSSQACDLCDNTQLLKLHTLENQCSHLCVWFTGSVHIQYHIKQSAEKGQVGYLHRESKLMRYVWLGKCGVLQSTKCMLDLHRWELCFRPVVTSCARLKEIIHWMEYDFSFLCLHLWREPCGAHAVSSPFRPSLCPPVRTISESEAYTGTLLRHGWAHPGPLSQETLGLEATSSFGLSLVSLLYPLRSPFSHVH